MLQRQYKGAYTMFFLFFTPLHGICFRAIVGNAKDMFDIYLTYIYAVHNECHP